jgi:ABC-type nitrate/sulfonate/bicarbonate transport system permease component
VIAPRAGREARKEHAKQTKSAMTPNYSARAPYRKSDLVMTHQHWWKASRYLRNAELVLPSPFSMIRAMSETAAKRTLWQRIFG